MIPFRLWAFSLSEGVLSSLKKRFSFYKGGCKKLDVFYSPSKMPVGIPAFLMRSWSVLPFIL
ncbi:MAG TPA: hypothetical protein DEV98_01210 [Clostridiales bacterium]|nr:hypothetical protein [Clostridiales bacterium]